MNILFKGERIGKRAMWYRIFGLSDTMVQPAALQAALRAAGWDAPLHVRGDDLGWTAIEIPLGEGGSPLLIERYLTDEDEIRDKLDAWAAWLETRENEPNHQQLMQLVIGTKQLFTLQRPLDQLDEERLFAICDTVAQWLARQTRGVYQIDTRGFFAADGTNLLAESTVPHKR
jgi:hypothetical protein